VTAQVSELKETLETLRLIKLRPRMFLGGEVEQGLKEIEVLEAALRGGPTRTPHIVADPRFMVAFDAWLLTTHHIDARVGLACALKAATNTEFEAWTLLWRLLDEFVASHSSQR
jgi:hypothetical protein